MQKQMLCTVLAWPTKNEACFAVESMQTWWECSGQMGEGGEHLQKAASGDIAHYLEDVAPDGVDEHDAMMAKLRDETQAAQGNLPTEAAATGKWQ